MVLPKIPDDVILVILAALSESDGPLLELDDSFPKTAYKDLLACALVCRVWKPLASEELYRHLKVEVKVVSPVHQQAETDSLYLERTLVTNPELGKLVRTIKFDMKRHWTEQSEGIHHHQSEAIVVTRLAGLLQSCQQLVGIELSGSWEAFDRVARNGFLKVILRLPPQLKSLIMCAAMNEGAEDPFGVATDVTGWETSLGFRVLNTEKGPNCDAPRWELGSLKLAEDLRLLNLPVVVSRHSATLTSLHIELETFTEHDDPACLSTLVNLRCLCFTTLWPTEVNTLLRAIEPLQHLKHFALDVHSFEPDTNLTRTEFQQYRATPLTSLPFSLTRIELHTSFIGAVSMYRLIRQPERRDCLIIWFEDDWTPEQRELLDEAVDINDARRRRYFKGRF